MSQGTGLVQCEVTGNWVSEDEVVTFQGKRVGAEGKAILLERLRSGADAPGTLLAPTVGSRFVGMFVDNLVGTIVGGLIAVLIGFGVLMPMIGDSVPPQAAGEMVQPLLQIGAGFFLIPYFAILHFRSGQTLGKKAAHTKVVDLDGGPITSRQSWLRSLYYYFPAFLASILGVILGVIEIRVANEEVTPAMAAFALFIAVVAGASGIYTLADAIVALADRSQQRSIHDRLAKTRVIRVS